MKVDVLLGLQWGDEGKCKVVDVLTPNYDIITCFQDLRSTGDSLSTVFGKKPCMLIGTFAHFVHDNYLHVKVLYAVICISSYRNFS